MKTQEPKSGHLLDVIQSRDTEQLKDLIKRGLDVNAASKNGWTPLMLAILNDSLDVAKLLLDSGADPNLVTTSEENPCRSPLAVAISNGRLEMVEILLTYQVDVSGASCEQLTPLNLALKLSLRSLHKERIMSILSLLENA